jgi:perosamine synthetase
MDRINQNGKGVVFMTNASGQFLGTVTDGDIRRGVLSRKSLNFSIADIMKKDALAVELSETDEVIEQKIKGMSAFRNIKIVPLLKNGKCVDYYESIPHFFVPISAPALRGNELTYVHECVNSGWISSQGSYVTRFENTFSKKYQIDSSVSVMNATCGLHLALKSLGLNEGDEVIVPSLTFAASINAVIHAGAVPVLVDVREDWCIDPAQIEKAITPKTKAIMPVHLYGQVCDMDAVLAIAKKHQLKVVEDCAEAQGATYRGKFVGSMGDIGCFSFFANKIMTTGEGGMNTTQSPELHAKMKKLRDHGKNTASLGYFHDEVGFNFRMTNIQAAIGVAQMEKVDELTLDRRRIQTSYEYKLKEVKGLAPQSKWKQKEVNPVCWLVSYVLDESIDRDSFVVKLRERGVDVRPFFLPMHQMEIYKKYSKLPCPVSERLGRQGVNLPTSTYLPEETIDQVVSHIKEILN